MEVFRSWSFHHERKFYDNRSSFHQDGFFCFHWFYLIVLLVNLPVSHWSAIQHIEKSWLWLINALETRLVVDDQQAPSWCSGFVVFKSCTAQTLVHVLKNNYPQLSFRLDNRVQCHNEELGLNYTIKNNEPSPCRWVATGGITLHVLLLVLKHSTELRVFNPSLPPTMNSFWSMTATPNCRRRPVMLAAKVHELQRLS